MTARKLRSFIEDHVNEFPSDAVLIAFEDEGVFECLDRIVDRMDWLDCLEAAGVDNWSGCEMAADMMQGGVA